MSIKREADHLFRFAGTLSRRRLLRGSLVATAGMLLSDHLQRVTAAPTPAPVTRPQAKSVIQIWMWGGPSHLDTFDPKPEAGADYCGELDAPIDTSVDGLRICQLLPRLAAQADKYAIIRSTTHGINSHETASYMVQTGHQPGSRIVYPSVGAVVSYFKGHAAGYQGLIPPYIVLTQTQGRFSEAGFLGPGFKPFATGGDPGRTPFAVEGIVAEGITEQRQRSRRTLMNDLDSLAAAMADDPNVKQFSESEQQAYDLILGDAGKVFDLAQETDDVRSRYGRNTFGQSCLMARRLVEHGVPYVTINYKGWDTHKQHFPIMRRKLPELDNGLATLLEDLAARGLLDTTIVWCGGEFGRTPKVQWEAPWNGGRGHFGRVFSTLVAGGGLRGGQVIGASDATGEYVKDRPVQPRDIIAAMYEKLGIDADAELRHPQGDLVRVLPEAVSHVDSAGRLTELL